MAEQAEIARYRITHGGNRIEVEIDDSAVVSATVRLRIDDTLVSEKKTTFGTRLHGKGRTGPVTVRIVFGIFGSVSTCALIDGAKELPLRKVSGSGGDDDDEIIEEILDILL